MAAEHQPSSKHSACTNPTCGSPSHTTYHKLKVVGRLACQGAAAAAPWAKRGGGGGGADWRRMAIEYQPSSKRPSSTNTVYIAPPPTIYHKLVAGCFLIQVHQMILLDYLGTHLSASIWPFCCFSIVRWLLQLASGQNRRYFIGDKKPIAFYFVDSAFVFRKLSPFKRS